MAQPLGADPGLLEAPTLAEMRSAQQRLACRVRRTPLVESEALSRASGRRVFLKLECNQHAGSFKPRGALNAALLAMRTEKVAGLATYSSGNHGQAVALAASMLSVPCLVVAPEDVSEVKLAAMEGRGAEVVRHGLTSAERMARATMLAAKRGFVLIPPYDDRNVVAGQGTIGLELDAQAPPADACVVPVGGGGLLSGIGLAWSALRPSTRLVGVEPEDADDARRSIAFGRIVENEQPSRSACDGLRNTRLGDLNFEILQQLRPRFVTVTDRDVLRARELMAIDGLTRVEPSGAAAPAAVLAGRVGLPDETIVAVVSGGNVAEELQA